MSRLPALLRLALHELWISYRLIPIIGLPTVAGAFVSLVPADLAAPGAVAGSAHWLAIGLAVALPVVGAVAAATLAAERGRGTLAWMAVRAVPRSSVVVAWFLGFALLLAIGVALGAAGAWLAALERAETPPDPGPFMFAVTGTIFIGLLVIALGLLIASRLAARPAALLTALVSATALVVTLVLPQADHQLPTGALAVLYGLDQATRPISDAVRSAGLSLAATAVLLVFAAAGTERADL